ncbi:MAG: DUF3800 domain-containing protein [Candidatus Delongbacteria bacterium]|nr:DUF3800 domain-containing protein [Candidatus Delongbacteria bacterium]
MNLLYCDESCHLPNDHINLMVLGTMFCEAEKKRQIFDDIRGIKERHSLSPHFEIKWTKVSPAKIDFYIDLVEYFFNCSDLRFRSVVAKEKDHLDHSMYNNNDYNEWYYKMYYLLLDKIIFPDNCYDVFIDIKDTRGGKRLQVLQEALCNNRYDFKQEVIRHVNQIHSHESEILQLCDLFIGALSYFHRGLYNKKRNGAKSRLIDLISKKRDLPLKYSSSQEELKFNMFIWLPRRKEE